MNARFCPQEKTVFSLNPLTAHGSLRTSNTPFVILGKSIPEEVTKSPKLRVQQQKQTTEAYCRIKRLRPAIKPILYQTISCGTKKACLETMASPFLFSIKQIILAIFVKSYQLNAFFASYNQSVAFWPHLCKPSRKSFSPIRRQFYKIKIFLLFFIIIIRCLEMTFCIGILV